MDLIEFWMVGLIISRDVFITLLRMKMKRNNRTLMTSTIAKSKTTAQLILIVLILSFLSIKNLNGFFINDILTSIHKYNLVYNLTFLVTLFTLYTGYKYVQDNYDIIKK